MSKKASSVLNTFLATLGTVCVVLGLIVLIQRGTLSSGFKSDEVLPSSNPATSSLRVLIVDAQGARVVDERSEREAKWPEDDVIIKLSPGPVAGFDLMTNEAVYLGDEFKVLKSVGLRSPDAARSLLPDQPRDDGTGAVRVRDDGGERTLVLRSSDGAGVREASPIGWWDEKTMAIVGVASSGRALFAVGLAGGIRQVALLPSAAEGLRAAAHDGVGYVTAVPGEGLESAPQPPAQIHRVTLEGMDTVIAVEEAQVIGPYAMRMKQVAYQTEDGKIWFQDGSKRVPAGSGLPVAMADERVYERRGMELWTFHLQSGEERRLTTLRDERTALFILTAQ